MERNTSKPGKKVVNFAIAFDLFIPRGQSQGIDQYPEFQIALIGPSQVSNYSIRCLK